MVKNLLKIAIRNILKEKTYSLINILGLSIGITGSVFLGLYIIDELSYDKYHQNASNIYRIVSHIKEPDNEFTWAVAQIPLADELKSNYADVIDVVRFYGMGRLLFKNEDKQFYEEDVYLADSTVMDVFTYQFLAGDPETALDNPNSIILTKSLAIKYFGEDKPLDETLQNQRGDEYQVTAVIEDIPTNSHFHFDALISKSSNPDYRGSWGNFGVFTYIHLPEGYDLSKMNENFEKVLEDHVNPIFASMGITVNYVMQRITDIHLHSKIQDEAESNGDISYIYIFSVVAFFMLIIASINYMNLATARSVKRAKEVGIRKVMGSQRNQLIYQFISESLILSIIALVVSIGLIYLLLPQFNQVSGKVIPFSYLFQPEILIGLISVVVFVGIVAGSYPAFYLSGFKPVDVLSGKTPAKGGNSGLRKVLVVFQFSISVFMLISTMVVYDQLQYLQEKDLGFNKDHIVRMELASREIREKSEVIRNKFLEIPSIINVASASDSPGSNVGKLIVRVDLNDGTTDERGVDLFSADYDFIETLGMTIVEGRNFSRDILSDTSGACLVNESMVKRMSWDEPLGKRFYFGDGDNERIFKVVGVVKDYHQNSLYSEIEPLMILHRENRYYMYVKIDGTNIPQTMASLENAWKDLNQGLPFEYQFLDQDFDSQYDADRKRGTLFTAFSTLTIVIACLGLLGLASFTTEQRTKEIGIRKVVGANLQSIIYLVSKEFLVLILIAIVLAFPAAYYFMDNWLQSFSYKININNEVLTFLLSSLLAIVITLSTVGFHTIRAAISNPVNALRNE